MKECVTLKKGIFNMSSHCMKAASNGAKTCVCGNKKVMYIRAVWCSPEH